VGGDRKDTKMGVKVPDRGKSKADFMHNALRLRKEVTELLLRDFGVKGRVYEHMREARMDDASREKFLRIIGHYDVREEDREELESIIHNCTYEEKKIAEFPAWLVEFFRKAILRIMENLMGHLYMGNSIYITMESEYQQRRNHWNAAIGCVYNLAAWLDYIRLTLPVDANKYGRYLERCQREIDMLRGVRKSDNAVMGSIRKRQAQQGQKQ